MLVSLTANNVSCATWWSDFWKLSKMIPLVFGFDSFRFLFV